MAQHPSPAPVTVLCTQSCLYSISNCCHKTGDIFNICAVGLSELKYAIVADELLFLHAGLTGVSEDGQYGAGLRGKFTAAMICQFTETFLHVHRVQLLLHHTWRMERRRQKCEILATSVGGKIVLASHFLNIVC